MITIMILFTTRRDADGESHCAGAQDLDKRKQGVSL
jgi:hypothetical protein